ncbi:MAG: type II toxin-antitoxin system HipA family toxin [Azonexus sp.]|nr:type II toxin-antitoxin system HipA family toxin [Betaproteobacteria bacterium]MBK8919783.1 type II toxin-antitoxin system HipA family toxin [Betaproteobacteria bacterium]MBP6035642.1 type II toxin-antitoxin system HipA family toxin [Azonexus sp.]MBP6908137.1 type II toxin-antitoxin system HipA family toxin [Azonexus sp.]
MNRNGVEVYVDGVRAGTLSRSDLEPDTFLFGYAAGCEDCHAVSLTMPVVADQVDSMGFLHPIFEMNLPEGMLRQRLELMFAKVLRDFDALTLLDIVGRSQVGRLRYASQGKPLDDVPAENVGHLLAYRGTEDLFSDLLDRYARHSGISGLQPKVLVRDEAASIDRITDRGATHIVKSFNPGEFPELAANEFFSMQAARHAGLPTARVQLAESRALLVVERFDRTAAGSYLGFEDFCVLSGLRASGRYSGSYETLARRVATFVSPQHHPAALRQLFGTVALCSAIGNGDAHLKNFAVLYDAPGVNVRLAPVYDMLSTRPYLPRDGLALELDGSKAFPSRRQLMGFARQSCGLAKPVAEGILARVGQGVLAALAEMQGYAVQHPDFAKSADRLSQVFREGLARLGL